MRALFLTRYTSAGASSRYRTFQHLAGLEAAGIRCTVAPLLDERYLEARFAGARPTGLLLRALRGRLASLRSVREHDLVVVEKELLPYAPGFIERLLVSGARRLALDFDDATFHVYDDHPRAPVRALLGRKFRPLLRAAHLVTAGNPYLVERLGQHAERVELLPTVLDLDRYPVAPPPEGPFTIGWIGTPVSARNLEVAVPALARVLRHGEGAVRLRLIGAPTPPALVGLPVDEVPWDEETEASELARLSVGIMPLLDGPLERGKSGLKLLQYLASGRPVVASPVGVNATLVTPDVGLLADGDAEWVEHLESLRRDPARAATLGARGRALVEREYALAPWTARYASWLEEAAR